jgi:hypothetical protein
LMFAIDATASRAATWDIARELQAKMFRDAAPIGKLDVQLVYYRGENECRHSKWVTSGDRLAHLMNQIECKSGRTQIGRVLDHALRETEKAPVQALVFIGDMFEEQVESIAGEFEEPHESIAAMAGALGKRGLPVFMFQDVSRVRDARARSAFRLIALKSGGAYFEFNPNTARAVEQLSDQLNAIARLAVGDGEALQQIENRSATRAQ